MESDIIITVTSIPSEVVEYILEKDVLSVNDVVQFGATCKQLQAICRSKKLWKTKFYQSFRYPNLGKLFVEFKREPVSDWMVEVKRNLAIRRDLVNSLREMSSNHFDKEDLSPNDLSEFSITWDTSEDYRYPIMVDELLNFISNNENLTLKYYAKKILRHLKQSYLTYKWQQLINLTEEEQLLEKGAILVAEWCQPEEQMLESRLSSVLDEIAGKVREQLRTTYPQHPIFRVPEEVLKQWRTRNICDNQFSVADTRQILNCQCEVMFNNLGFYGNQEAYYSLENSYLNKVLETKKGIPITLSIVFESVARRLGVRCEAVNFPSHFLLRWKEKYTNWDCSYKIFYIDVFNGGNFLTRENCPRIGGMGRCPVQSKTIHEAASLKMVVERMAHNLELAGRQRNQLMGRPARLRSVLELLHMLKPNDIENILNLARFYMCHQMDLTNLVNKLIDIQNDDDYSLLRGQATHILRMMYDYMSRKPLINEKIEQKLRTTPNVKYAIGLVLFNKVQEQCCVVAGWDVICEASPEWMAEINVELLQDGLAQPFYNVFFSDGQTSYVAQEHLYMIKASEATAINHDQLGRYFSKFDGRCFLPNEELAGRYPQDAEARQRLLAMTV